MKELRGIARRQGRWEEEEEKFSQTFLDITVWELNPGTDHRADVHLSF